ncbi:MAG: hypothetical protein IPJ84_20175 [Bdellovibrionales bacterium]|nr:hypothetical protein [Bdellovibrionales bacterium]
MTDARQPFHDELSAWKFRSETSKRSWHLVKHLSVFAASTLLALTVFVFHADAAAKAKKPLAKPSQVETVAAPVVATAGTFFTATIHDLKEREKKMFEYVSTFELDGTKRIMTNTFTELAGGTTAAVEKTVMQTADGQWRLLSYLQEQNNWALSAS